MKIYYLESNDVTDVCSISQWNQYVCLLHPIQLKTEIMAWEKLLFFVDQLRWRNTFNVIHSTLFARQTAQDKQYEHKYIRKVSLSLTRTFWKVFLFQSESETKVKVNCFNLFVFFALNKSMKKACAYSARCFLSQFSCN